MKKSSIRDGATFLLFGVIGFTILTAVWLSGWNSRGAAQSKNLIILTQRLGEANSSIEALDAMRAAICRNAHYDIPNRMAGYMDMAFRRATGQVDGDEIEALSCRRPGTV